MWTLEHGVGTCRRLQTAVEPFGFSVALYGSVLVRRTGNDLDIFPCADAGCRLRGMCGRDSNGTGLWCYRAVSWTVEPACLSSSGPAGSDRCSVHQIDGTSPQRASRDSFR